MNFFKKIKARLISNYIIKQIRKISKTDTYNEFLRVTEKIKNSKYIYIKFNLINGMKDVQMNFIQYYNSHRKIEKRDGYYYYPRKTIFDYWKIYKKRLPSKLYKYLDLLSKRYNFYESEKVRKFALMVIENISNSRYELSNGSVVLNTIINSGINCYKITLKFL
jgi:hypothetical protein